MRYVMGMDSSAAFLRDVDVESTKLHGLKFVSERSICDQVANVLWLLFYSTADVSILRGSFRAEGCARTVTSSPHPNPPLLVTCSWSQGWMGAMPSQRHTIGDVTSDRVRA